MKFKDIFIILVFIGVLAGVGLFIRMGERSVSKMEDTKVDDNKLAADVSDTENKVTDNNKIEENKINNLDNKKVTKEMASAILHTTKGDITIEFFADKAPNTVANFLKLAKEGFYNGIKFHRVIKGFMIQSGDPLTKDDSKMDLWGTGGPGYKFADEIGVDNKNDIGTIAMANSGPNTNGSQFFINVAANNFLDSKHTVFGKVISGMDVVKAIENTQTGTQDRPVTSIVINNITIK